MEKEQWQFFKVCCGKGFFFRQTDRIFIFSQHVWVHIERWEKRVGWGQGFRESWDFYCVPFSSVFVESSCDRFRSRNIQHISTVCSICYEWRVNMVRLDYSRLYFHEVDCGVDSLIISLLAIAIWRYLCSLADQAV